MRKRTPTSIALQSTKSWGAAALALPLTVLLVCAGCGDSGAPAGDGSPPASDSAAPSSDGGGGGGSADTGSGGGGGDGAPIKDSGTLPDGAAPSGDSGKPPAPKDGGAPSGDSGTPAGDSGGPAGDIGGTPLTVCQKTFGQAQACGGNPVGTWQYAKACTDTDPWSALRTICAGTTGSVSSAGSAGTLVMRSNGTFTRTSNTTVQGTVKFPASCAAVQLGSCATIGALIATASPGSSASCSPAGGGCTCNVTTVLNTVDAGSWTQAGAIVTAMPAGAAPRDYYVCVKGRQLTYRGTASNSTDNALTYVLTR